MGEWKGSEYMPLKKSRNDPVDTKMRIGKRKSKSAQNPLFGPGSRELGLGGGG